jgi:hypothetical protein
LPVKSVSRESWPDSTRTAYHEAGHVVAAVLIGRGVEWVTIVPNMEVVAMGETKYRDTLDTTDRDVVDRHAVVSFAGPLAEARVEVAPTEIEWEEDDDFAYAACFIAGITDPAAFLVHCEPGDLRAAIRKAGVEERMRGLVKRAECLVEEHWSQIETVAHALIKTGRLEREEVERLVPMS